MKWSEIVSGIPSAIIEDADAMSSSADLKIKAGKQLKKQAEIMKLQKKTADKRNDLANITKSMTSVVGS